MREWMRQVARTGGVAVAVGAVLGLLGPFGTFETLATGARLAYWVTIVAVNWLLCEVVIRQFDQNLPGTFAGRDVIIPALGSVIVAVPATAVVYTANVIAGLAGADLATLFWRVLLVCVALSLLVYLNTPEEGDDPPAPQAPSEGAPTEPGPARAADDAETAPGALFFQRLEKPLSGKLLCVSTLDHYLSVETTEERQLVLCRMEDASRELAGLGYRVHRSWWVATDAVAGAERENGRPIVRLVDGRRIPVGRTYRNDDGVKSLLARCSRRRRAGDSGGPTGRPPGG